MFRLWSLMQPTMARQPRPRTRLSTMSLRRPRHRSCRRPQARARRHHPATVTAVAMGRLRFLPPPSSLGRRRHRATEAVPKGPQQGAGRWQPQHRPPRLVERAAATNARLSRWGVIGRRPTATGTREKAGGTLCLASSDLADRNLVLAVSLFFFQRPLPPPPLFSCDLVSRRRLPKDRLLQQSFNSQLTILEKRSS